MLTLCCAVLALSACGKASDDRSSNTAAVENGAGDSPESIKGVDRAHKGSPAPEIVFDNPDGDETSIKAFAGKPTLVNLWATWCAPCVKELPTLDALARRDRGKLNVLAISQDMAPHASVDAFLDAHKIATLESYQDPKMALSAGLRAEVLPTSILYDARGRELWRYVGDLDWSGPEAAKLLAEAGASPTG